MEKGVLTAGRVDDVFSEIFNRTEDLSKKLAQFEGGLSTRVDELVGGTPQNQKSETTDDAPLPSSFHARMSIILSEMENCLMRINDDFRRL